MYLWKAWHDCRARIALYILAAVSIGVLCGLEVVKWTNFHDAYLTLHPYRHSLLTAPIYNYDFRMDITFYTLRWAVVGYFGRWAISFFVLHWDSIGYGPMVMLVTGLSLGASSVGREVGASTMNFVLTRPCPRRNFVLTDWTVGLTGMVIILSGLAFTVLAFLYAVHAKGPGNVLAGLPALWVLGAAIYGLAHFTTLMTGSASKGLILSVATLVTYSSLPTALNEWWHTDTLLKAVNWTLRPLEYDAWPLSPFDWSATAFWLAVAAGFLGASLAWIRWREV
jgi:ABC-type transport system involved in multi-copper enzyme maturation permease subunit